MLHGYAWATYDDQRGPRGDKLGFVTSMAMTEALRDLAPGTRLGLQTMLSLDPLMDARGYPNLFATGETAGRLPLVDRQHPQDLFMELFAKIGTDLGGDVSGFLCGGPIAEPALGPSAFMRQRSARVNPQSADHASLVRFDPHHLWRRDSRTIGHMLAGRSLCVRRPRAGRAPVEYRDAQKRQLERAHDLDAVAKLGGVAVTRLLVRTRGNTPWRE